MTTTAPTTPLTDDDYDRLMEMYPPKSYLAEIHLVDENADIDPEALPKGMQQELHFTPAATTLRHYYRNRRDVLISVDNFVYYQEGSPNVKLAPDIMVAFDVDPGQVVRPDSYLTWIVGKPPDFVMEVASKSTWRKDLGSKRDKYAEMGVSDYCMLDPSCDFYGEPLVVETLVDGRYRRTETRVGANGVLMWHSPKLGLWLYVEDEQLRFYDPVEGRTLNTFTEEAEAREAEHQARLDAEAAHEAERQARLDAEAAHESERQARLDAEAEVARLREQLRQQSG